MYIVCLISDSIEVFKMFCLNIKSKEGLKWISPPKQSTQPTPHFESERKIIFKQRCLDCICLHTPELIPGGILILTNSPVPAGDKHTHTMMLPPNTEGFTW